MSDTQTQAALALDTLGKPTARLTGGYQSAQTPPKWSYATRIQPDKIPAGRADGSDLPVYRLFFPAQRNVDGTMTKNEWWEFPRHLTILQERVDTEFPNGFQGKYRADISWRVRWGKSGNSLYIKEILSVEGPMQAPTELDQHLNANGDQQTDKPQHEMDEGKAPYAMAAHVKRVHGLTDDQVGKVIRQIFNESSIDAIRKRGVAKCWKQIEDFDEANKPGEVAARFAPPAEPPAPEAPPAGATDAGAISLPEPQENATLTISDGKTAPVSSGMSEAGFSMNFFWCDADGAETQFTMREATWQAGLENVEKFKAGLRKLGYMPKAEYAKLHSTPAPSASAPAQATMPAPAAPAPSANGNGGSVWITEIKKITDEGKTRYELFAGAGQEKPELIVRLDGVINNVIAKHININDMQVGTRYAVNWKATYSTTTKFNQKANRDVTYRDLTGITPAA